MTRVTKDNPSQVSYQQSVICDGQITAIDVTLEIWVIPDGQRTWEFFAGSTETQAPMVVTRTPFFSENVFRLVPAKACKNGLYVGRAFATVRLGAESDGGELQTIPTLIGGCPGSTGGGPVVDPNNPPDIPGSGPRPGGQRSPDEVASSVRGKLLDEARAIIRSNGYLIGNVNRQITPNFRVNEVINATTRADRTTIDLQVSSGTMAFQGEVPRGCALSTAVNTLPSCASIYLTPCSTPGATMRCRGFDEACERPRTGVFDMVCQ